MTDQPLTGPALQALFDDEGETRRIRTRLRECRAAARSADAQPHWLALVAIGAVIGFCAVMP